MGTWKIFDGTNWVDPCDCPVYVLDSNSDWKLIDPINCEVKYYDGTNWCPINCNGEPLTSKTEINIWFDNSGSMGSTYAPLETMRDTLLQACLLSVYNNDIALYNERVKVVNMSNANPFNFNERFVRCLAQERNFQRSVDTSVNKVINLTFQDESSPYGYGLNNAFDNSQRNGNLSPVDFDFGRYDADITYLRNILSTVPYTIKGTAFRVNTLSGIVTAYPGFRDLTEATFVDNGAYSAPNNVSDYYLTNFNYYLDIVAGSTPTYYRDQIVIALNALGIIVPVCP